MRSQSLVKFLYFICLLGISALVYAHPHMFIDTRLEVRLDGNCPDGNRLDGLEITWYFDPMFTASIVNDFDEDGNNFFSEHEIDSIYENAFSNLADFDYFTFVNTNSTTLSPCTVEEFTVYMEGQTLVYRFFAPFDIPISDVSFAVAIYDDTYYCDILYHEDSPITLTGPGSENATFQIVQNRDIQIQYGGSVSVYREGSNYTGLAYPQQVVVTMNDE